MKQKWTISIKYYLQLISSLAKQRNDKSIKNYHNLIFRSSHKISFNRNQHHHPYPKFSTNFYERERKKSFKKGEKKKGKKHHDQIPDATKQNVRIYTRWFGRLKFPPLIIPSKQSIYRARDARAENGGKCSVELTRRRTRVSVIGGRDSGGLVRKASRPSSRGTRWSNDAARRVK